MTGKDFTDEVLASKYLNACMFGWGTKTTLRIWGVDHNPELAMPTQEIYAMVRSYKNKPTIANPSDPYDIVEVDEDNGIAYVDWYTEAPGVELTTVPLDHCEYDEHLGWKLRDEYVCEIPDDAEVSEYTEEETVVVV